MQLFFDKLFEKVEKFKKISKISDSRFSNAFRFLFGCFCGASSAFLTNHGYVVAVILLGGCVGGILEYNADRSCQGIGADDRSDAVFGFDDGIVGGGLFDFLGVYLGFIMQATHQSAANAGDF